MHASILFAQYSYIYFHFAVIFLYKKQLVSWPRLPHMMMYNNIFIYNIIAAKSIFCK